MVHRYFSLLIIDGVDFFLHISAAVVAASMTARIAIVGNSGTVGDGAGISVGVAVGEGIEVVGGAVGASGLGADSIGLKVTVPMSMLFLES